MFLQTRVNYSDVIRGKVDFCETVMCTLGRPVCGIAFMGDYNIKQIRCFNQFMIGDNTTIKHDITPFLNHHHRSWTLFGVKAIYILDGLNGWEFHSKVTPFKVRWGDLYSGRLLFVLASKYTCLIKYYGLDKSFRTLSTTLLLPTIKPTPFLNISTKTFSTLTSVYHTKPTRTPMLVSTKNLTVVTSEVIRNISTTKSYLTTQKVKVKTPTRTRVIPTKAVTLNKIHKFERIIIMSLVSVLILFIGFICGCVAWRRFNRHRRVVIDTFEMESVHSRESL